MEKNFPLLLFRYKRATKDRHINCSDNICQLSTKYLEHLIVSYNRSFEKHVILSLYMKTDLTLSGAAPLAVSKVRGAHCGLCPLPHVSKGIGGLMFQIFVATSYLTQIDTRQKDLQLSDTLNHPN